MEKIELETPKSSSTNLKEDALCKVLGPEKNGRLRTFGKGVTLTKLTVLSQMSGHIAQLHEENVQHKSQVAHMQNTIDELKKNQTSNTATTEGTQTTPIVSPSRVTTNPDSDCKLLHWTGTGDVVDERRWSSSDPNERVHHIPLGPNAMRVWVDVAKNGAEFLWRPTSDMETIEDVIGTTVAWPVDNVLMDFTPRVNADFIHGLDWIDFCCYCDCAFALWIVARLHHLLPRLLMFWFITVSLTTCLTIMVLFIWLYATHIAPFRLYAIQFVLFCDGYGLLPSLCCLLSSYASFCSLLGLLLLETESIARLDLGYVVCHPQAVLAVAILAWKLNLSVGCTSVVCFVVQSANRHESSPPI
ncbi:hypothetical protein Vadar_025442 [Vaccinium darrowii]|uniref:Uncharacterized protein n=1 Tax=Vaccinium darrowii TaxID=229202 RepID=A0ACB7X4E8_9ERIC|nr:hypothetical protein Vadar_025442 [Vaccinium darrowii]